MVTRVERGELVQSPANLEGQRLPLLTRSLVLNLFAASLYVLSETTHRIATCDRAQHAQQHQCRENSFDHDISPDRVFHVNSCTTR